MEHERLPSHQWLIEFEREPDDASLFCVTIDEHLRTINRHYRIRREADAFDLPDVCPLPHGTFYAWLEKTRKRVSAQTKVPRMSAGRTMADGLCTLLPDKPQTGP